MNYEDILKTALFRAREAFMKVRKNKDFSKRISRGYGGDVTLYFDEFVENAIIDVLEGSVQKILSEEKGIIDGKGSEGIAIVDPVDGSTNASRTVPFCASTITIAKGNRFEDIVAAGTIDLINGDLFLCYEGNVYCNDEKVFPSNNEDLNETLTSIDLKISKDNISLADRLVKLSTSIRYIRFLGAIALELAYVASGKLDAFIVPTPRVRLLDIIGGLFMVKTSGGYVEIIDGDLNKLDLFDNNRHAVLATGNSKLAEKIKKIIYS